MRSKIVGKDLQSGKKKLNMNSSLFRARTTLVKSKISKILSKGSKKIKFSWKSICSLLKKFTGKSKFNTKSKLKN